jgi:multidrug transporter EmrE-like cation transporter
MVLTKGNLLLIALTILEISTLSLMNTNSPTWLIIMLYGLLGYGLRELIREKGLIGGNAIYDFFGIIGSTIVAVIFFGEKMTIYKIIGLLVGMLSLYLLNM